MYLKSIIFSKLDIFITFSMQISIPAILKQKSFTTENFTNQYWDERRSKQSTTNQRSQAFLSSFLIGPRYKKLRDWNGIASGPAGPANGALLSK